MLGVVQIDFQIFFYMVVGLFGLVGFYRGWWKEAITTGLLTFLLLLLEKPEWAAQIIEWINSALDYLRDTSVFSASGAMDPPPDIDPATSQFYIVVMIVLIVASYFIGRSNLQNDTTSGGKLFGGILGLTNGFIALSLIREYIIRRFLPGSGISASAVAPPQLTLTITDIPRESITDGLAIWILIIAGAIVFLGAITTRYEVKKGLSVAKKVPPGYSAPKKASKPQPLPGFFTPTG